MSDVDWETEIFYCGRPLSDYADHIREECARVVERLDGAETEQLVAAIRALKDKE